MKSIRVIKNMLFHDGHVEIPGHMSEWCLEILDDLVHIPHRVATHNGNMLVMLEEGRENDALSCIGRS